MRRARSCGGCSLLTVRNPPPGASAGATRAPPPRARRAPRRLLRLVPLSVALLRAFTRGVAPSNLAV